MAKTILTEKIASEIVAHIKSEALPPGTKLPERKLAEILKVSRSPIRDALMLLHQTNVVASIEGGGYEVHRIDEAGATQFAPVQDLDDEIYFRIADDRLEGRLPVRISENELIRRYSLTRSQMVRVTRRIANEGWAERLPGRGWEFVPMMDSLEAYRNSYRFRIVMEPAAILEPTFEIDTAGLSECLRQQEWLLAGGIKEVTAASLFEMNSNVHETIVACSRNSFFIDTLKRVDRLRRLIEYRQSLDRERALLAIRDHIALVKLILEGKRVEASDFLRRHLEGVAAVKTKAKTRPQV